MIEKIIDNISNIQTVLEQLMMQHGIAIFILAQMISGMGLLLIVPDGVVTPTFTLLRAENLVDVISISIISAGDLVAGNSLVYSFSRHLGDRFVSDERKETRLWRFMDWLIKRHPRFSMVFLRLLPVGGELAAIPAGLIKLRYRMFLLYSFIGFFIFETALGLGAWYGVEGGVIKTFVMNQIF